MLDPARSWLLTYVLRVTNDPEVAFVDIGSVELKGVSGPVRLHEARRNGQVLSARPE